MRLAWVSALGLAIFTAGCTPHATPEAREHTAEPVQTARAPAASASAELTVTSLAGPFAKSRVGGVPAGAPSPSDVAIDESRRHQTILAFGGAFNERGWDALSILPEPQREAVRLRVVEEAGYDEVAAALNTTPAAARVRVTAGSTRCAAN